MVIICTSSCVYGNTHIELRNRTFLNVYIYAKIRCATTIVTSTTTTTSCVFSPARLHRGTVSRSHTCVRLHVQPDTCDARTTTPPPMSFHSSARICSSSENPPAKFRRRLAAVAAAVVHSLSWPFNGSGTREYRR
ncbi:unnamed protein product [Trichogramma brassicae]|uniref:Uncharacterized protein n=1 Tax=Trichogramma brassicae TaxID=86971 RepID=A0A6H5J1X7_9HYME|nr:unnamed protein product [Trichogramma brassicae]